MSWNEKRIEAFVIIITMLVLNNGYVVAKANKNKDFYSSPLFADCIENDAKTSIHIKYNIKQLLQPRLWQQRRLSRFSWIVSEIRQVLIKVKPAVGHKKNDKIQDPLSTKIDVCNERAKSICKRYFKSNQVRYRRCCLHEFKNCLNL